MVTKGYKWLQTNHKPAFRLQPEPHLSIKGCTQYWEFILFTDSILLTSIFIPPPPAPPPHAKHGTITWLNRNIQESYLVALWEYQERGGKIVTNTHTHKRTLTLINIDVIDMYDLLKHTIRKENKTIKIHIQSIINVNL